MNATPNSQPQNQIEPCAACGGSGAVWTSQNQKYAGMKLQSEQYPTLLLRVADTEKKLLDALKTVRGMYAAFHFPENTDNPVWRAGKLYDELEDLRARDKRHRDERALLVSMLDQHQIWVTETDTLKRMQFALEYLEGKISEIAGLEAQLQDVRAELRRTEQIAVTQSENIKRLQGYERDVNAEKARLQTQLDVFNLLDSPMECGHLRRYHLPTSAMNACAVCDLRAQRADVGRLKIALGVALPHLISYARTHPDTIPADDQRTIWHSATDPIGTPQPPTITIPLREYQLLNQIVEGARTQRVAHCHEDDEACDLCDAVTTLENAFRAPALQDTQGTNHDRP